jgi:hypothetical protein
MGGALKTEPITVNCICPGLVPTGLLGTPFTDAMQADMLTPTSTIVKAINNFLSDPSLTGQAAECSGADVIYRPHYEAENEAAKYMLSLSHGNVPMQFDLQAMGKFMREKKEYYDIMERDGTTDGTAEM